MPSDLLIILLGVASSITLVCSALSTHKPRLLIFGIITSILVIFQYSMTGAIVGLVACSIGLLRSSMVLTSLKWGWLNHKAFIFVFIALHIAAFSFVNDWSNIQFYNFLAPVGSILAVVAIYFKNLVITKSLLIGSGGVYLFYELFTGAYGHMVGEATTMVANAVAIALILRANRRGVEVEEPVDDFISSLTGSIPVITDKVKEALTGSIPVIRVEPKTDTKPFPAVS